MQSSPWKERDVITRFSSSCQLHSQQIIRGIGDDCAVLAPDGEHDWVVTTDMLVDTVHFDTSWHPAYRLGRKCLAVNLSDIAAMGATPRFILLSIAIPVSFSKEWLDQWTSGFASLLDEFSCSLIGGDTVRGDQFTVNITAIGTTRKGRAILRSTAAPGESIFVSGELGSAAAGLILCREAGRVGSLDETLCRPFLDRHLDPAPDVACALLLAESGLITAMQDLSDGLATDLAHIADQSMVGARVEASLLPRHKNLAEVCTAIGHDPVQLQIAGGDDYHLVFTVQAGKDEELLRFMNSRKGPPIYRIGETFTGSGVRLQHGDQEVEITFGGFQHRSTAANTPSVKGE